MSEVYILLRNNKYFVGKYNSATKIFSDVLEVFPVLTQQGLMLNDFQMGELAHTLSLLESDLFFKLDTGSPYHAHYLKIKTGLVSPGDVRPGQHDVRKIR